MEEKRNGMQKIKISKKMYKKRGGYLVTDLQNLVKEI